MAADRADLALEAASAGYAHDTVHASSWAFDAAQAAFVAHDSRTALTWLARVDAARATPYPFELLAARIHEELGQRDEAIAHFEHARALGRRGDPFFDRIEAHLRALRFPSH